MASKPEIKHWPGCSPKYPEKPERESLQSIMETGIFDGEIVLLQCKDCGAFIIVKKEGARE